nr:hypothetical protein [Sphingomonas sp.]
ASMLDAAGFTVADDRLIEVPWQFDDLDEAGEFCRNLFGMTGLGIEETAAAMEREIGFEPNSGHPRLQWELRRIVADAI